MARRTTSVEAKAAAMADLMAGEQPALVAARYNLNPATVRSWKIRLPVSGVAEEYATGDATMQHVATVQPQQVIRRPQIEQQHIALNDLIARNLRAKLEATESIARHVQSEAWLNRQTAADVATLYTALDKSAVDILDRMAAAHPAPGAEQQPGEE